jgi:hypothetical protein
MRAVCCWGVFLTFFATGTNAAVEPAAKSCVALEYRQFDFWVGEWTVFDPSGKKVGDSRVERINDGCALLENWQGGGGITGKSLNVYDAEDKYWHQFWVDSSASRLQLKGALVGKKMVLTAVVPDSKKTGSTLHQRITWSQNADGSVRQHWETSNRGGKTWSTVFDGKYVRKP